MTTTLTAAGLDDLARRKLRVATVLLDKSMRDLDQVLILLAERDPAGMIVPAAGARLRDVRESLDVVRENGLLALAELEEANQA